MRSLLPSLGLLLFHGHCLGSTDLGQVPEQAKPRSPDDFLRAQMLISPDFSCGVATNRSVPTIA